MEEEKPSSRRHRDAVGALPPLDQGKKREESIEETTSGTKGGKRLSREILRELVEVVKTNATEPLLKSLRLGPLADFKEATSLKKCTEKDYILDPKSAGYTTFMEFCKKKNSHDCLLSFTHFYNKMIKEQADNYENFMILFHEAWKKFLNHNSKQSVSLGDDHARNVAALKECYKKYWDDGKPKRLEYFLPPPDELIAVAKEHAKNPLLKTLIQGPFADFKADKSFKEIPTKIRVDDIKALQKYYILDPKSAGYTKFMEFCEKQNSQDYLLSFTHFNNKMIEEQPNYENFMKLFHEAWEKFLTRNAKQSVGLGGDHAKNVDALQKCFDKYWDDGKPIVPT